MPIAGTPIDIHKAINIPPAFFREKYLIFSSSAEIYVNVK
jgi:hypothetical protein